MRSFTLLSLGCGVLLVSLMASYQPASISNAQEPKAQEPVNLNPAGGKYIGSKMCKNCHKGADKGDAHGIWEKSPHAKAWETLATPAALAAAKELGIEKPQEDAKCLKCHATAYGFPAISSRRASRSRMAWAARAVTARARRTRRSA